MKRIVRKFRRFLKKGSPPPPPAIAVASQNIVHTSRLDEFVAEFDRRSGIQHPDCAGFIHDFQLAFDTKIDGSIDPFSDEYFASQVALRRTPEIGPGAKL